jgi:predicted nucleic acid-binding protein
MANRKKYLVDTSVISAMFRRNEDAKKVLDSLKQEDSFICDISVLEILVGCHTVSRREQALCFLEVFGQLKSNETVSNKAIQLMARYCVQHPGQPQFMLADCLIAAYALSYKMELLTFNKRDFDFIQGISIHPMSK